MSSLSDEATQRQVEQVIGFDPWVSVFDVNVSAGRGVVRLDGIVENLEAKASAAEAARGVPGVARVDNLLTVQDPRGLRDPQIEGAVADAIDRDPGVDAHDVGATVLDGTAHLVGHVDSVADEHAAIRAASRAEGVRDVVSELDISPGRDVDWTDLKNQVVDALDDADDLTPYGIDVEVETDGRVILSGTVNDEHTRARAAEVARGVDGVKEVIDRL